MLARRRQLYEGKAKILFEGPEPGSIVQYFKDDATAGNGAKKGIITGKGVLNNRISEHLMLRLQAIGIPTHFMKRINMREQLVREVEIIPLEIVVRNVAAGSIASRLGLEEGTRLPRTIIEYYLKNDALNDRWYRRSILPPLSGPPLRIWRKSTAMPCASTISLRDIPGHRHPACGFQT